MNKYAVVLAAGKGTRMKSSLHKVLHPVLGKSMVDHAVTNLQKIGVEKIVTVIGYEADSVRAELKDRVEYAMQTEQLGTGHAVMMTKDQLEGLEGVTIVTYGDVPLLTEQTIANLFDYHQQQEAAITILTAKAEDPTGYGRIIRDEAGNVLRIVEQKDANAEELLVQEINTGVCCYDNKVLFDLYCVTGSIGQIVAPKAKKVIGIELIEEAVEAAKENAKLNGLNNCKFLAGDVAEIIKTIKDKPDIIILDPPRSGVHPKALEYVIKFNAKEIIYVSCNPKTLVNDLKVLLSEGYKIIKTRDKDMFPNTPPAETVVKLIKE